MQSTCGKNDLKTNIVLNVFDVGTKHQNILLDEIIELERVDMYVKYPKRLRRVVVWNEEHQYKLELLTNNFDIAASSIAALYEECWQIAQWPI